MEEKGPKPIIELDPRELLGFSQMAKVSAEAKASSKLLSKVGEGPSRIPPTRLGRLLSKIGKGPVNPD